MKLQAPAVLEVLPEQIEALGTRQLSNHLEHGGLVKLSQAPIELPSEQDRRFLREATPPYHRRKNVSYDPMQDASTECSGRPPFWSE